MNTRSGSYELLAGGSIGRFASLAAALVTAAIGVVGVGVVTVPALAVAYLLRAAATSWEDRSQPGRVGCPRLATPNKSGCTPATVGRFRSR